MKLHVFFFHKSDIQNGKKFRNTSSTYKYLLMEINNYLFVDLPKLFNLMHLLFY